MDAIFYCSKCDNAWEEEANIFTTVIGTAVARCPSCGLFRKLADEDTAQWFFPGAVDTQEAEDTGLGRALMAERDAERWWDAHAPDHEDTDGADTAGVGALLEVDQEEAEVDVAGEADNDAADAEVGDVGEGDAAS
jgi:hypothetical protein